MDQWLMAEVTTSRFSPTLTTKMRDGVVVFASPRKFRVFHRDRGQFSWTFQLPVTVLDVRSNRYQTVMTKRGGSLSGQRRSADRKLT